MICRFCYQLLLKNTVSPLILVLSELEIIFDAMQGVINHVDYELEYFIFGNGPKVLIAFHGFNNNAEDFRILGDFIGDEFKIVAVNLFFHGASKAEDDLVKNGLSTDELKKMFLQLADRFPAKSYTLLGFSLGGRIVLKMVELLPEKIERVILLAPDGIHISRLYRLLTNSLIGKWVFKQSITNPIIFFKVAIFLRKTRLVSEKKFQFARQNFDTEEKRQKVFLIWMVFRKIISRKSDIKTIIRKHRIPFDLFFGKYDKIIPPSIGRSLQKGVSEFVILNVLEAGHKLLKEKVLKDISRMISPQKNDARKT